MSDHSGCEVAVFGVIEDHMCQPCPHGCIKGFTMTLTGDSKIDALQRSMKMQTLDGNPLGCDPCSETRQ